LKELVDFTENHDKSLYVRKCIANALSHCTSLQELHYELAAKGVPVVLDAINQHSVTYRNYFEKAIRDIAVTVLAPESSKSGVNNEDLIALQRRLDAPAGLAQSKLVESGLMMYLHTALGGAIWGAYGSIRAKESLRNVLKNSVKTSLVTGLIPIYFVGLGVSLYNYLQKKTDTSKEKFFLTFFTCMSTYPWIYLLPVLDKKSPQWIGGHVTGFTLFFVFMLRTGNDFFRSDTSIMQDDIKQSK